MSPEQAIVENEMNSEEETDDEETSQSPTTVTKIDRKRRISHSEIERRRREKMNRYIDEIAQLLPIDAVKKLDKLTVLRVAVETVKHLQGASSKVLSDNFSKQIYLNDNELLELTLATIDKIGTYFFLIIECEKGQICYTSNSSETILGHKPPIPMISTRQNYLEIGNRRTFSCRLNTKSKRSNNRITTNLSNNYVPIDFVGYIKQYSLTNETKTRTDRRHSSINILTPSDVFQAIGNNPVSCLLAMGNLSKYIERTNQDQKNGHTIDRSFLWKLNSNGHFTYFDQICHSLLGYPAQDLLGMNFIDLIHEDDRNKLTELWNRICCDRQIVTSINYRFRTKNNTYIVLQTIFEPFVNPWNDELEIVVARNKLKVKSVRTHTSTNIRNEKSRSIDGDSSASIDSTEILRQLLS